jgi:regulatory protein
MIKVKRITKKRNRYVLDLENENKNELLNVSEDVVLAYNLFGPRELTSSEYKKIIAFNDEQTIYDKLLYFIQYQPRSEYQVIKKARLLTDNYDLLKRVIFRLEQQKYINDFEYAKLMTESYIERNRLGPKGIAYKLSEAKVSDEIITNTLEIYSDELQYENINHLFLKELKQSKNKSIRRFKESLFSKLIQKGYDINVIQIVIDAHEDEIISQIDEISILRSSIKKEKGNIDSYKVIQTYIKKGFKRDHIDKVIEEMK